MVLLVIARILVGEEPHAAGTVRYVIRGRASDGKRCRNRVTLAPSARPGRVYDVTVTRRSTDLSGSSTRTGLVRVDTMTRFPACREPGPICDHLGEAIFHIVLPVASNPARYRYLRLAHARGRVALCRVGCGATFWMSARIASRRTWEGMQAADVELGCRPGRA